MAKKPSLSSLTSPKPAAAPIDDESRVESPDPARRPGAGKDGRKGVLVRVEVAGWRQLRDLAAELTEVSGEQHSMQSLIVDQINRLLREHGRPPVA